MAKGDKTKIQIRYREKAKKVAKRGFSAAARMAKEDKDMLSAGVAAFIIGKLEAGGTLKSLPSIRGLDPVATLGVLAYIAHRYKVGGRWAFTAATAALSVGAYRMGVAPPVAATTGDGDYTPGETPDTDAHAQVL